MNDSDYEVTKAIRGARGHDMVVFGGLFLICLLMAMPSLGGALFASSKATMFVWGSVKDCPDAFVCLNRNYLNERMAFLAMAWAGFVIWACSLWPGIVWRQAGKYFLLSAAFTIALVGVYFFGTIARVVIGLSEPAVFALDASIIIAGVGVIFWRGPQVVLPAAVVSLSVLMLGISAVLWFTTQDETFVGEDVDVLATAGWIGLIWIVAAGAAALGLSAVNRPAGQLRFAGWFAGAALGWSVFALVHVVLVWIWFLAGRWAS